MLAAAAALLPLLLYSPTLTFGFVHADDVDLIAGNSAFLSDPRNVPAAFARSYFQIDGAVTPGQTYYRPLAIVSFMADTWRGGGSPAPFHATNVALHALATLLLMALARAWGASWTAGFVVALLFAVHPANVHAVAWVAGRNDLLLTVFSLAALLALARGSKAGAAVHALAFAGALFSKELALAVPALAFVHIVWVQRRAPARVELAALAADAAIVLAWAVLAMRAQAGLPYAATELAPAFVANLPQLLMHAGKLVLPVGLNVTPGVTPLSLALGAAAAAAIFTVGWLKLRPAWLGFATLWTAAFLLPTLLVPGMPAYEHRLYVTMPGLLLAFAAGSTSASRLPRPLPVRTAPPVFQTARFARQVALACVLVALAGLTWLRLPAYADAFSFWTDAARDARFGAVAHVNLGQLHEAEGRPSDARHAYLRALQLDSHTPKARNNLGVLAMADGDVESAGRHFLEETRRHPQNADGWYNLGLWHAARGDRTAADAAWSRAITANPAYTPAYEQLGLAARGKGTPVR